MIGVLEMSNIKLQTGQVGRSVVKNQKAITSLPDGGIGTLRTTGNCYMSARTQIMERLSGDKRAGPVTYFDGVVYKGGIMDFDPDLERNEPLATLPPFDAADRSEQEIVFEDGNVRRAYEKFLAGAITNYGDISSITVTDVLDEVLSMKHKRYGAIEPTLAMRSIPMPNLQAKIDYISTKMSGQAKVPDLVEAELEAEAFTQVTFDLWKNVVHIAKSDVVQKKGNHPFLQIGIEQASKALASLKNSQIITALEGATTDAAAGTWHAMTTAPNNDNDPGADISDQIDTIESNGGNPDKITMDTLVWRDYVRNSFVKAVSDQTLQRPTDTGRVALPGFPELEIVRDTDFTATASVVYDSQEGFILGQGPIEAARYRNEAAGYDAYIIREYLQPLKIDAGFSREITGVR